MRFPQSSGRAASMPEFSRARLIFRRESEDERADSDESESIQKRSASVSSSSEIFPTAEGTVEREKCVKNLSEEGDFL